MSETRYSDLQCADWCTAVTTVTTAVMGENMGWTEGENGRNRLVALRRESAGWIRVELMAQSAITIIHCSEYTERVQRD